MPDGAYHSYIILTTVKIFEVEGISLHSHLQLSCNYACQRFNTVDYPFLPITHHFFFFLIFTGHSSLVPIVCSSYLSKCLNDGLLQVLVLNFSLFSFFSPF